MSNLKLWIFWGCLYLLCGIGGCVSEPEGAIKALLMVMSFVYFLPPAVLLYRSARNGDKMTLKLLRNVSFGWLMLTLALILCNILSVFADPITGLILHYSLVLLASPLVCGQVWVIPMFFFACLMIAAHKEWKK